MYRTRTLWLVVAVLLMTPACSSTDPSTLPYRPYIRPPATVPETTLRVLPAPQVDSPSLPLQISAMRTRDYPGSNIIIEAVLDPGVNYSRYYVSYLSDGLKIYALMTVPHGQKPPTGWPVIIFNHGYIPPNVYRTTERYIAYVDMIASNGYIVFKSDYRGHDQSEGFAGGVYTEPNYSVDVLNAVASMKHYADADPNRIGMWGHSMGGYITLRSMVVSQDIKAGVIWAGVVAPYPDLFTRWNASAVYVPPAAGSWVHTLEQSYGSVDQNPQFWDSISANAYVSELSRPIQLHHGTADQDVPWQFSQMLYDEMIGANQVAEFYIYEGDNHNISNSFSLAMGRTIEFFDRYLKTDL